MAEKCPKCRMPVSSGDAFCGHCGASLPADGRAASPVAAAPGAEGTPRPVPPAADAFRLPFSVTCAAPEAFQVGRKSSIVFRFEDLGEIYTGASIELRSGDRTVSPPQPFTLPHGEATIHVDPEKPGWYIADAVLVLECDGAKEVFKAPLEIVIDEKAHGPSSVNIGNITIDNDGVWRNEKGAALFNVAGGGMPPFPRRYACDLGAARPLEFRLEKSPEALSLVSEEAGDEVVLVAKDETTFGRAGGDRSGTADVELAVYDGASGAFDRDATGHVSARHLTLSRVNGRLFVSDGAGGRASTNGTALDGETLERETELRPGRHELAFLRFRGGGEVLRLSVDVATGGGFGQRIAGAVFRRTDCVSARFAVFMRGGKICVGGARLRHDGGAFTVSCEGEWRPVAVGTKVAIDGAEYTVMPKCQRDFIRTDNQQGKEERR